MRKKILVVDQDPAVLKWFRATQFRLENEFSYFFLDDETKLIDAIQRIMPDLIIMDVDMNGVSGPEVAELLHHTAYYCVPVVYLSTETWLSRTAKYPGMNFLPKPLTQTNLDQKIRTVLSAA